MELDILILNKNTFEIQVLDYLDYENVMYSCASNSSSFLDSLFFVPSFFQNVLKIHL